MVSRAHKRGHDGHDSFVDCGNFGYFALLPVDVGQETTAFSIIATEAAMKTFFIEPIVYNFYITRLVLFRCKDSIYMKGGKICKICKNYLQKKTPAAKCRRNLFFLNFFFISLVLVK